MFHPELRNGLGPFCEAGVPRILLVFDSLGLQCGSEGKTALAPPGCAQLGSSSCSQCAPDFVEVDGEGRCEACVDTPGWTSLDAKICIESVRSDTMYYGLSSNQACCRCGGGQGPPRPSPIMLRRQCSMQHQLASQFRTV